MKKITVTIEGMRCPKCSAKVEAALSDKFAAKSITVSHTEKTAVILTEYPLDHEAITAAVKAVGFTVTDIQSEEAQAKRSIVKIFKRK